MFEGEAAVVLLSIVCLYLILLFVIIAKKRRTLPPQRLRKYWILPVISVMSYIKNYPFRYYGPGAITGKSELSRALTLVTDIFLFLFLSFILMMFFLYLDEEYVNRKNALTDDEKPDNRYESDTQESQYKEGLVKEKIAFEEKENIREEGCDTLPKDADEL